MKNCNINKNYSPARDTNLERNEKRISFTLSKLEVIGGIEQILSDVGHGFDFDEERNSFKLRLELFV